MAKAERAPRLVVLFHTSMPRATKRALKRSCKIANRWRRSCSEMSLRASRTTFAGTPATSLPAGTGRITALLESAITSSPIATLG